MKKFIILIVSIIFIFKVLTPPLYPQVKTLSKQNTKLSPFPTQNSDQKKILLLLALKKKLEDELKSLNASIKQYNLEIKLKHIEIFESQKNISNQLKLITGLKIQLGKLIKQKKLLLKDLRKCEAARDKKGKISVIRRLKRVDKQIVLIKRKINKAKHTISNLKDHIKECEAKIEELKIKIKETKLKIEGIERKLRKVNADISKLQIKLKASKYKR